MSSIIATLPKVDLYCRLAGALDVEFLGLLAAECDLPEGNDEAALRKALSFADPAQFEAVMDWASGLLRRPGAWERAGHRIGNKLIADNVVHAELYVDVGPGGVEAVAALEALDRGLVEALEEDEDAFLSWGFVLQARRGGDVGAFTSLLSTVLEANLPRFVAIALLGDEDLPAAEWAPVMELAKTHSLGRIVQAGFSGGNRQVQEAIDMGASRLLHALRADRDDGLALHLRAHRLPVVVAPELEVRCGRSRSLDKHPLARMREAGLFVVAASGAPGIMEVALSDQFELLSRHMKWRLDEMRNATARAIEAACIDARLRFTIARAVENWRHRPKLTPGPTDDGYSL